MTLSPVTAFSPPHNTDTLERDFLQLVVFVGQIGTFTLDVLNRLSLVIVTSSYALAKNLIFSVFKHYPCSNSNMSMKKVTEVLIYHILKKKKEKQYISLVTSGE